ncbi:MAG: DsbA family protein [Planctomycetota bacterium]
MAKRSHNRRQKKPTPNHAAPNPGPEASSVSLGVFIVGLLCLVLAVIMSGMLVLDHLGGISLPGCGEGSPCAEAAASVWGKVPIVGWPVSFLGFAYFTGALVAWPFVRKSLPQALRNLVRLGALISLGFVLVIIIEGHHCSYCLWSHAGNFGFWLMVEFSRRSRARSLRPIAVVASTFVVVLAVLLIVEGREERVVEAKQEKELQESVADIIAADAGRTESPGDEKPADSTRALETSSAPTDASETEPASTTQGDPGSDTSVASSASATPDQQGDEPPEGSFTGRWRLGPERAPVRLVMFTDYQCVDCNRIEAEVRKMMEDRDDVSLSIKHFPMCTDCNRHFQTQNLHPNACWAARAAEAAGILGGNEGFWRMHHWLFDHTGLFTNETLPPGLVELGFDPQEFVQVMMSDKTLPPVEADIEEAIALGLYYTPMAFINGEQLRGVFAQNAIPRAVAAIAAQNPPALTSANDHPPTALEKCIGDWRWQQKRRQPPAARSWARGPADAKLDIVVWGDYEEQFTAEADGIIREFIAGRDDARYWFRHYPFNQACNPVVTRDIHPLACRMAQAAEAAGELGGLDGYWKMHVWLLGHQEEFSDDTLRAAAIEMGFDADAIFATMERPEIGQRIADEAKLGKRVIPKGVPTIYVNGRWVPRFTLDDLPVLQKILEEASGGE